jgi:branched-chain amino acid transport system substrate-binding protein
MLAAVLSLGALTACGQSDEATTYKIGALVSQTGSFAGLGIQALDGIQVAIDEVNDAGGIDGVMLELVVYDDKSEVSEVPTAMKKMDEVDKVVAVVEGSATQLANALIPVSNDLEIPAAGISGTALLDDSLGDWFFRPMGSEVDYVNHLLEYIRDDLGVSSYGMLIENTGYGQGGQVFLPLMSPDFGVTIASEQYFDPGATDLSPQINNIANSDAGAIIIWGSTPTASMAIKQVREMGVTLPILTTPTQATPSMIEAFGAFYEMEPVVVSVTAKSDIWRQLPDDDPDKDMLAAYDALYQAKYDVPPAMWCVLGTQMIRFIVDGLQRSTPAPGDVEQARAELRDALEQTTNLDLLTATYTMSPGDHYGCTRQKLVLVTYENGQLVWVP